MELVLKERVEGILHIQLNNPDKLNALSDELKMQLRDCLKEASEERDIRGVLISGKGTSFSSGGDIDGLLEVSSAREGKNKLVLLQEIINTIYNLEIPVVCAVHGNAVGAGFNLALASDILFSTPGSKFSQIFSNIGLVPDGGGMYFLPKLIGNSKAKDLIFTGRFISGEEAYKMGIVTHLVDEDHLIENALEYTLMLSKRPTYALGCSKKIINQSNHLNISTIFEMESTTQGICLTTEDFKEGVKAFKEKRKPNFKGK